jgi:hypothetical protein
MKGAFSVDVEPDLHTNGSEGIHEGLLRLIDILNNKGIKATLFVTGKVLEKNPTLFKNLKKQGHEIALHGYAHKRYDLMNSKEKEEDIERAIKIYRKLFGANPRGFRAPQHSIDKETIALLEKYNFKYDSSKTPGNALLFRHLLKRNINLADISKNFFSKMKPYKIGRKLVEIPRSTFLIATGGFELKVCPPFYYKTIINLCKIFRIPFIFVMHSWDMIDVKNSLTTKFCSKKVFEFNLKSFINYSSKKVEYVRMEEIYEKVKNT